MLKSSVDILVLKMYSYDTAFFNSNILDSYKNPLIINFNFDKIWVEHKPANVSLKHESLPFCKLKMPYLHSNALLFFETLINFFIYLKITIIPILKYRPKIVLVEHTYVAVVTGFFARMGICQKGIYAAGDWLASDKNKKKVLSYVHSKIVFPFLDFLACQLNDLVINYTPQIAAARYGFWGRNVARNEKSYAYKPKIAIGQDFINTTGNKICFIGNVREDSGLDVVISALASIRKKHDISVAVIGKASSLNDRLIKLSEKIGVSQFVHFMGFIETDKFQEVISDCFCGINILQNVDSYSACTIPGKFFHYLQYLLPVVTTEGGGPFIAIIRKYGLGIVINHSEEEFVCAVAEIYKNQRQYKKNILNYIRSLPELDLKTLLGS